jgi:hypothetical protein
MGLFLPNFRSWFLENTDTGQVIQGQFEPDGPVTKDVKSNYETHTTLNRQNPITQYINGTPDAISFQARIFNQHSLDFTAEEQITLLELWAKRDPVFKRPPIVSFWMGDAHVYLTTAVITGLSGIQFGRPSFFGGLRDVTLTINLQQYEPFDLEDSEIFETRYHHARVRDYYEMLTEREYGNPLLGDVIRKRHPTLPNVQTGDVIKLPSIEAIRTERVDTKSIPLKTAFGRKDTVQRKLRIDMLSRRDRPYVSHVLIED